MLGVLAYFLCLKFAGFGNTPEIKNQTDHDEETSRIVLGFLLIIAAIFVIILLFMVLGKTLTNSNDITKIPLPIPTS
ncbi:MAG TPA: hypothetical protein VJB06_01460 [archaeon]|nr:hypothetical protein [archaeon]